MVRWSVIIPTLNEEGRISACLAAVRAGGACEVVVSDGGSSDRTLELARPLADAVVEGPPGRGGQLNRGAQAARGTHFLFLHADALLPAGWLGALERAWAEGKRPAAAAFRIRYDASGWGFRLVERGAHVRAAATGMVYGDHGLAIARSTFLGIGGYPELPLMEDVGLAEKLRRLGGIRLLRPELTVSSRKLSGRPLRNALRNHFFRLLYGLGVSPYGLYARYYAKRRGPILLVFLKAPVPGAVKTRLAAKVGPDRACRLYRKMAREVFDGLRPLRGVRVAAVYEASPDHPGVAWATDAPVETWPQASGDLGARLEAGFARAFEEGGPVAALGADSPGLPVERLREAFEALRSSDVVLGPTRDGGFYLLGLRKPVPGFFEGLPWSSGGELEAAASRAGKLGLSLRRLEPFYDIDEEADLALWPGSGR